MNLKTWTPLALAIVLGLIAAKVARDALARSRAGDKTQARVVKIVVARGPVAPGQPLTAEVLTLGPIAVDAPPAGSFTDPTTLLGRVTVAPLFAGQPVLDSLLAPAGIGAGLQALVPRGMRAITVEVNDTTGLAGLITPGCHVDVVCTLNGGTKDETLACTIVQDVLVQAVGQRLAPGHADEKEAPARSVTLVATPRDAEAIELASSTGRTRLVLRGAADRTLTETAGVSFVELRRDDVYGPPVVHVPVPVVAPPPPVEKPVAATQPVDPFAEVTRTRRRVTLIKGGVRSEVVFDIRRGAEPKSGEVVTSTNDGADQE